MRTSCAQIDPFPPWQVDGEPQLKEGQYFSRSSCNVEIYKLNGICTNHDLKKKKEKRKKKTTVLWYTHTLHYAICVVIGGLLQLCIVQQIIDISLVNYSFLFGTYSIAYKYTDVYSSWSGKD